PHLVRREAGAAGPRGRGPYGAATAGRRQHPTGDPCGATHPFAHHRRTPERSTPERRVATEAPGGARVVRGGHHSRHRSHPAHGPWRARGRGTRGTARHLG